MLRAMFVDPRPLLQRYVAKKQPTYPLDPPILPTRLILNESAHLPTDVPMLTAVLVVRQLPRHRGRHTCIATLPTFRCLLMLRVVFADHKLMLQCYVCGEHPSNLSTQTTPTPNPTTNPPTFRCFSLY